MAKPATRIYTVTNAATGIKTLIEATTQGDVARHIARTHYDIQPTKATDVAAMLLSGVKYESANPQVGKAAD